MPRPLVTLLALSAALVTTAVAQRSPHVGRESLAIKVLTLDEIRPHLEGDGMGYALAAELNGYPGPRHVLELADSLGLTAERRAQVQAMFEEMRAEAVRLGEAIVAAEASLDSTFAAHRATAADLEARLGRIADLQRTLRYVHLSAHLRMMTLLSREQARAYQRLRGYAIGHRHGEHGGEGGRG